MGRTIKFILFSLLALSFFSLRWYELDKRFSYGWDQEHLSYEVKKIVKDHKFTLLGPQANNDKGFFLGPYFTYLLIPFFLAASLHPIALMWVVITYNIFFFLLVFFILLKIKNDMLAYFFLFLWSVNPILIAYDINPWWPLLIPLGVVFLWILLFRLHKKNTLFNLINMGVLLGFLVNLHFQVIFLILFTCLFFIIDRKLRKSMTFRSISIMGISFIILMLPLLFFDLRHSFLNTKLFINFFLPHGVEKSLDPFQWIPVFTNFVRPFIYSQSLLLSSAFYVLMMGILYYLQKKKDYFFSSFYRTVLVLWITFPLLFSLYRQRPSEYYFLFLYPFILFTIVDFFITIRKTSFLVFLSIFFLLLNMHEIKSVLRPSTTSLYYKDLTIKKLKEITSHLSKKYNISYNVPSGWDTGYRYLVKYYDLQPTSNPNDPLIEINIPPKKGDIIIGAQGIKIPDELKN